MPGFGQPLPSDLEGQDEAAAYLPFPQRDRFGAAANVFHMTQLAGHAVFNVFRAEALGLADPTGATDPLHPGPVLQPDEANARYGVDGYQRFNRPVTEDDAAWQSAQAVNRRWRDTVLSRTRPTPLRDFGASLVGALTDPVGLGVMLATDGLGEAGLAAAGLGRAAEAGAAVTKLGRVWNAAGDVGFQAAKGAAFNTPYVALDAALSHGAGDDMSMGDALRDIAAGAILHTGLHYGGQALDHLAGRFGRPPGEPQAPETPLSGVPPEPVQAMAPEPRAGALAIALDDVADDRPVDVGQYVQRELEARQGADPTNAAPTAFDTANPLPEITPEPAGAQFDLSSRGTRRAVQGDTGLDYSFHPGAGAEQPYVSVDLLRTPEGSRGQGGGRAIMEALIRQADAEGMRLALTPDPIDRATSKTKLTAFYKTLGFKPNKDAFVSHSMLREAARPSPARQMLGNLADRYARNDPGKIDLRAPGKAAEPVQAQPPEPVDLRHEPGAVHDPAAAADRLAAAGVEGAKVEAGGELGPVLTGLEGRYADAVKALQALGTGDARGVLEHPSVGAIDLPWGGPKGGLAHILAKHPGVVADLPDRLAEMDVESRTANRVKLAGAGGRASVRLDYDGKAKTWLLTAFEDDRPGGERTETAPEGGPDRSPGRPADGNIGPEGVQAKRPTGEQLIAADPELKALAEDTERLAAENGVELGAAKPAEDPNTLAEAIRAAAVCQLGELG
jgi:GNAT superfamily N-acetyltransferase